MTFVVRIGDDEKTVRAERMKLYRERPLWLRPSKVLENPTDLWEEPGTSFDRTDKEFTPEETTAKEVAEEVTQREADMAQETTLKTAETTDVERKFRVGDKVGIYFEWEGVTDGRNWYCGVILKTETRKQCTYVEFLDGSDGDWYLMNHEMRHCPDHTCGEEPCFFITELGIRIGSQVSTPRGVLLKNEKEAFTLDFPWRDTLLPLDEKKLLR